jgi:hypothetical protein
MRGKEANEDEDEKECAKAPSDWQVMAEETQGTILAHRRKAGTKV